MSNFNNWWSNKTTPSLLLLILISLTQNIWAAPLDDVSLQQKGEDVEATITLTTPVHFLRFVPNVKSRVIEIYYERVPSSDPAEAWVDQEVRNSPATSLTPAFTVTTRDQATQPKLVVEFAKEVNFLVNAGGDSRSFVITLKPEKTALPAVNNMQLPLLPAVVVPSSLQTPPAAGSAEATQADVNQQAYKLMQAGHDALADKNYSAATEAFNNLLLLPPNLYSQDAQEWVGVARERGGQNAKAKAEYELYLKLYSSGNGFERVQQRLARLGSNTQTNKTDVTARKIEPRSFVQGSISSSYYFGQSNFQTSYPYNNTIQTDTYSIKDQASLITNLDAVGRFVNDKYDNRLVYRDVETQNYLLGQSNTNYVYAAYLEMKNKTADYSTRVGRQTTGGGGVMGRFDGVYAGYGSQQDLRVNVVAGQLVDFTTNIQPIFYGTSVDRGPVSMYLIDQTIQGVVDRRAAGAEYKYFEGKKSAYALIDYDIYFNKPNTIMLTSSYGLEAGTTLNFIVDYRKNLSIRNALNGSLTTSVLDLLTVMNEAQLKQLALDRSVSSTYAQMGATQRLNVTWQVGGDIRLAKTSGMPASGSLNTNGIPLTLVGYVTATLETGLEKTVSAQLIGTNLFTNSDLSTFGASVVTSDYVKNGETIFISNRIMVNPLFSFDSSWNYYQQADNYGGNLSRHMPMVHGAYQLRQNIGLDAGLGYELSTTTGPNQTSINRRISASFGFRWNF
jgi:hypothetical protein